MAAASAGAQVRLLLLDIEGTTTPADFVYRVLFPYARERLKEFVEQMFSSEELQTDIALLRREHGQDGNRNLNPPPWDEETEGVLAGSVTAYLHWQMDLDRKSTVLKSIQGRIWKAGYLTGRLQGQVYPDVPVAFERWQKQERKICIFSSGSILAQKLLFGYSTAGDLTPHIDRYFDTAMGSKKEPESYSNIAGELALSPREILFVSDVVAELDAALQAGMKTVLCVRREQPGSARAMHPWIHSFAEVFP